MWKHAQTTCPHERIGMCCTPRQPALCLNNYIHCNACTRVHDECVVCARAKCACLQNIGYINGCLRACVPTPACSTADSQLRALAESLFVIEVAQMRRQRRSYWQKRRRTHTHGTHITRKRWGAFTVSKKKDTHNTNIQNHAGRISK